MKLIGKGFSDRVLSRKEIKEIVIQGLEKIPIKNQRVLVLTPDSTRSGPMALLFQLITDALLPRVKKLDFLVALGTHRPMSKKALQRFYGIAPREHLTKYSSVSIYNHCWDQPDRFARLGVISAQEIEQLTKGKFKQEVMVALNKMIFNYDHLLIYGPVFPHEVAGFSGGHKYFFPGIAGPEIINFTHWLGAIITSFKIIGIAQNPVRAVIERASQMVKIPRTGISAVVKGACELYGLYLGDVVQAWKEAVKLSSQVHIKWVSSPYRLVISVMPEIYDELWTAAKGMYKLEPVVEDGGELIIYAPHIKEVSYSFGKILDRIGYHCRDYFLKQWDKFSHYPWGVLAHSTHLRGLGKFENGVEKPRIKVTLATGIPRKRVEKLGLNYLDPREIKLKEYRDRESEGILVVERAGEILYRLRSQQKSKV